MLTQFCAIIYRVIVFLIMVCSCTLFGQSECQPDTCTQMTATEQWIFLCAAHKTPKEVSIMCSSPQVCPKTCYLPWKALSLSKSYVCIEFCLLRHLHLASYFGWRHTQVLCSAVHQSACKIVQETERSLWPKTD